jgi:hypothetical protein
MFKSIRKKFSGTNNDEIKETSLDFKLMFVYHIAMMLLFGTRILDDSITQALFALALFIVLVVISSLHKFREKWKWPGISIFILPSALLNLAFVYAFLAFVGYSINPDFVLPNLQSTNLTVLIAESWAAIITAASYPAKTPWFLAGIGIGVFNLLSNLKIVTSKKSEFEAQCESG